MIAANPNKDSSKHQNKKLEKAPISTGAEAQPVTQKNSAHKAEVKTQNKHQQGKSFSQKPTVRKSGVKEEEWRKKANTVKFSSRVGGVKRPLEKPTSFLRARKTDEMLHEKTKGTYRKAPSPKGLVTFEPLPYEPVADILEAANIQTRNHQDPNYDDCLINEFWTLQGMHNTSMMRSLPIVRDCQVNSMDLVGLELADDETLAVGEEEAQGEEGEVQAETN